MRKEKHPPMKILYVHMQWSPLLNCNNNSVLSLRNYLIFASFLVVSPCQRRSIELKYHAITYLSPMLKQIIKKSHMTKVSSSFFICHFYSLPGMFTDCQLSALSLGRRQVSILEGFCSLTLDMGQSGLGYGIEYKWLGAHALPWL